MTDNHAIAGEDDMSGGEAKLKEPLHISLAEEVLEADIVEREQARIRLHKRIETGPVEAAVDLHHDQYAVMREEVDEFVTERREPWYEDSALLVPVYEEVLVTETKLRLKEIIRIENRGQVEQVNLRGTVRREVVVIDNGPDE